MAKTIYRQEELERQLSESRREFWAADATINNLEMKLTDMAAQLANAESKCRALAAENAKIADCANFYRIGFKPVKGALGIEYRPTEQLLDDCGNTAIEAIKTPATDAFLAEVRAQGVEMYADNLDNGADDAERGGFDYAVKFLRSEASSVRLFADQLRKGGDQ